MSQWEVYIYIKGFGADCYTVNAEDIEEANMKAVQRVLCETDYTLADFEVIATVGISK